MNFTPIEIFVAVVFLIGFIVQLAFLLGFTFPLFFKSKKTITPSVNQVPLSIIIAARNEAENLLEFLPKIFEQQYLNFEVIVVDDCSYDNTRDVLLAMQAKYKNLKAVFLQESGKFEGGKKFAITMGIKAATHNYCVFIDADCYPNSTYWLTEINNQIAQNNNLVLGYGAYKKTKGIINFFIRLDAAAIALNYMQFAAVKLPYMGVGRNLVYHKQLFFENKGFYGHMHLKSGDDDLFVNKIGRKSNVGLLLTENSKTISVPKSSFSQWKLQKARHISTSKYYALIFKLLLGLKLLGTFLWYIGIGLSFIFLKNYLTFIISIILFYYVFRAFIEFSILKKMGEKKLTFHFFWFDLVQIVLQMYFWLVSQIMKQFKWKN